MIGSEIGRYRILESLGSGGMGVVWKAHDTLLGRTVALKVIRDELATSPQVRRRFLRGAHAVAQLDHPGIGAVYEAGESGGTLFIALAFLDGESVGDRVAHGAFAPEEAARIGIAVAGALDHAHGRGVVHRDITSRNIMLGREGRVWLVDFGLAHAMGNSRLTSEDTVLGTLAYLAPEAFRSSEPDPRLDLYGLGVVLYEMLSGRLPFRAPNREALFYSILNEPPRPLRQFVPGVSEALAAIVERALVKDANQRFASAAEMERALRAAVPAAAADADPERSRSDGTVSGTPHGKMGSSRVIAILPFTFVGAGAETTPDDLALARGLSEALGARLAGLDVIPPIGLTGTEEEALERARQHGATLVLRGSLRRSSHRLRASYTLFDPRGNLQIAAGTVDGSWTDLLSLEDHLLDDVLVALDLAPGPPRAGAATSPTADERYVKALGYLQRHDNEASVDGAIRLLEELDTVGDGSGAIQVALGRAYLRKYVLTAEARWEHRAAAACQRALAAEPDSAEVLVTLATLYRGSARLEEAVELYRRVLALAPNHFDAWEGLARAFERLGRYEEALDAARRAIALRPESWQGYDRLGGIHFHRGRYAMAVGPWRRVTEITPDNPRGYFRLAAALFHLDRFEDAIAAFRKSIAIHPTAEAWTGLGTVLYYQADHRAAAEAFEKAVSLKPGDPKMWGNLSSALGRLGETARREQALDRAIALVLDRLALDPARGEDWAWLASWRAVRGAHAEALEAATRALREGSGDANVLAQAGVAFHELGHREEALRCVGEAVSRGYGILRFTRDPDLSALVEDPGFQRILESRPANSDSEE